MSVQQGFDILVFAVTEFRTCFLHRLNGTIYLSRREAWLRPCVLHLCIWLEQLYDTPRRGRPYFILFLLYARVPSKTRNDTTKVRVTLDYSQTRRLFNYSYRHNPYIH